MEPVEYDHLGISKHRRFGTPSEDWRYSVFRVGVDDKGREISSFVGVELEAGKVKERVEVGLGDTIHAVLKNKSVIPYDKCLNTGLRVGVHFGEGPIAKAFQVGRISDDELAKLLGFSPQ